MSNQVKPTNVEVPILSVIDDGTPVAAHEISAKVEGPQPVSASVQQRGANVVVAFTTTTTGSYKITATARGQAIQHLPVTVNVQEGKPGDAKVEPLPSAATYPVKFEVDAVDADGKAIPSNADLKIEASGPENVRVNVQRYSDKILLSFETTRQKGTFSITVSYQGRQIQRSPFDLTLTGKQSSSKEELIKLPPLPKTRVIQFDVPARAHDGSAVRASELSGSIVNGPERTAKVTVTDKNHNTLTVAIEVGTPGAYEVGVFKNGQHIEGSGFDIDVPQAAFDK